MDVSTINLIIGIAGGILGASIGALINGIFNRKNLKIQLQLSQSEARNNITLSKLEELHDLLGGFLGTSARYLAQLQIIPRDETLNQKFSELCDSLLMHSTKIHNKIRIYAQDLNEDWDQYSDCVANSIELGKEFINSNRIDMTDLEKNQSKLKNLTKQMFRKIENKIDKQILIKK
jgi:hypothetical protein